MLQGCPCSSSALCQADTDSVMYNHSDCDSEWPYISHVPSPGYWYFIHGGAGAIMSRGLMDITSYERCHDFIFGPMPRMSGGQPPLLCTPAAQICQENFGAMLLYLAFIICAFHAPIVLLSRSQPGKHSTAPHAPSFSQKVFIVSLPLSSAQVYG